jgi:NADH oxidase (H2O2-forming)
MAKIVILGLGAAGFGVALAAKRKDRKAEITIIDRKDYNLIHRCGLPFVLEGKIDDFSNLKHSINADRMGINLLSNSLIDKIDTSEKTIHYLNKQKDEKGTIKYDKLIIATGAMPSIASIKTDNKTFTVHGTSDTKELEKNIKKGEKAIIIGAGAVGLETAVALKKRGMDVKVLDMLDCTFPRAIDKDISSILEEKLNEKGIKLELGTKISEIKEKAIIVMATGVAPNIEVLKGSNIKIGKFGIEVNSKMETSVKNVYAVGDCCSVKSLVNGEKWPSMLANNAYREGAIAGANAAGGNKKFNGILGTFVSVIDDIEVAATGFNSFFAENYKFKTVIGKAKGKSKPEWYGPSGELVVKIIADSKGKVIGGQAIGEGAKERINIISTAIKARFSLQDITELELAYCPAVSDYYDVLVMAAEIGLRKI